ncbi:MAG: OprD family outer membrane porin [Endozoicomonadaceae bacterium]|nr:OprD family outer membrane porin [Endozoicomonadaceae bacterium]
MVLFRKKLLGSAIVMAMAGGVLPAIADDMESTHDMSAMQDMMSNSFFSDGKVTLGFKNYYRNTTDKNDKKDRSREFNNKDQHAWTQAFMADAKSGWFMNWVGADLSFYYNQKLDNSYLQKNKDNTKAKKNAAKRIAELLPVDRKNKANSYGKVGYSVRVNLMDCGVLKYGRMMYDTPLFSSVDEYATPSLDEGFYGDVNWKGLKVYAGHVTKHNIPATSGFLKLAVEENGKLKNRSLQLYGAEYTVDQLAGDDKLTLRTQQTYQRDFEKNSYIDAAYKLPSMNMSMGEFTVAAQFGNSKEVGINKDATKKINNKTSLDWGGAKVMWQMDKVSAGLSYTNISGKADQYDPKASATMYVSKGNKLALISNDFIGYTAGTVNDFSAPGTHSARVGVGYDCSDFVQGLALKAGYTFGSVDYKGEKNHRASEMDFSVHYDLPFVKNLSAVLKHGHYKERYHANDVNNNKIKANKRNKDTRIMLNYTMPL